MAREKEKREGAEDLEKTESVGVSGPRGCVPEMAGHTGMRDRGSKPSSWRRLA